VVNCGGVTDVDDAAAIQAQTDLTAAYTQAAVMTGAVVLSATSADLAVTTLAPGVYRTGTTLEISGAVTLDAQNNPNACFIFQVGSALNVDGSSSIHLIHGAQAANVFWAVESSATFGSGSSFAGIIMAQQTITFVTGAALEGRALALNAQVILDSDNISNP